MGKTIGAAFHYVVLSITITHVWSICIRQPEGIRVPKTTGDNGYRLKIGGNPDKYVPGEVYTVTLQGWRSEYAVQKFIGFLLTADPSESKIDTSPETAGHFQLFGDAFTRFSDLCPNAVTQTSSTPKTEVQVLWTAPGTGSGCILFRALVVESRETWFEGEGALTKELCEEQQENEDEQPEINDPCCACDEAKYEVMFEGLWSRQTHPKDFPTNEWLLHFSDIIGASHSVDYRVWEYGGIASDGLRQVAEWGATRLLEAELKAKSEHIRTIIKARGLWQQRLNGKTFAVFRVDRKHHLMSLVSMLGPSPDWIVGVSALELCLRNCSWVENKTLNLYPWDAGTDSGITYMSANEVTNPRQKIRRITTSYPADPRSPFYDPTGAEMKPLARIIVTRQRVYEKSCSDPSILASDVDHPDNSGDALRPECAVTEWGQFSPCSVTCGKGLRMRQRFYINQMKADMMGCDRQLEEKEMCVADVDTCDGDGLMVKDDLCAMSEWSQWSSCSVTCGKGFRTRTRRYLNRTRRKKCHFETTEQEMCMGIEIECDDEPEESADPECAVSEWSDWSPCSTTCGKGMRFRTRFPLVVDRVTGSALATLPPRCNLDTMEKSVCMAERFDCSFSIAEAKDICMEEQVVGPCRASFQRWSFDAQKGMCVPFNFGGCRGNRNNFETMEDCMKTCEILMRDNSRLYDESDFTMEKQSIPQHQNHPQGPPPIDCMVTEWSEWSPCSATCGRAWKEKRRMIKVPAQNGGKPCPKRLAKKKRCMSKPCQPRDRN